MREIPLSQGEVALVDDEDFEFLNQWKWSTKRNGNTCYATRCRGRNEDWPSKMVLMHRVLLPCEGAVDHRDGNGLNNCRSNLRPALTRNQQNSRRRRTNKSGFKGVYKCRQTGRWSATLNAGSKTRRLGRFDTKLEAAWAYDAAAVESFGEFARINFPERFGAS